MECRKFITKSQDNKYILIKHTGKHKCLPKSVLETQILEEIEDFFALNPTATRSEAIVHHLVNKVNFGTCKEVIEVVKVSLNLWELLYLTLHCSTHFLTFAHF